jgi:uncharacterized membrane protein
MPTTYNAIAGQSVERIAALSDGIFAVAMTLLVLDLKVPATEAVHSERDLWRALIALSPRLLMFGMSVLTLGIFWVGQQTQRNNLKRSDRGLSWIHIAFLGVVSLIPFSTALLAEFSACRMALVVYWLNILVIDAFTSVGPVPLAKDSSRATFPTKCRLRFSDASSSAKACTLLARSCASSTPTGASHSSSSSNLITPWRRASRDAAASNQRNSAI